ncbi:MAG: hypothetical protein IJC86_03595 [Clostridia bacterium]|nr:hypothetical protein [Clostridia bacterium]
MNKKILSIGSVLLILLSLGGCSGIGYKSATLSAIYIVTSILSIVLLLGYCTLIKNKQPWFILLFSAVAVVNIGYLSLSVSSTLNEALLSNRIAYLGSVFLPVSMLMAILKTCKITFPKWAVSVIILVSVIVFLIAASPGYLDIYYKEVTLVNISGATVLEKIYGPLHSIYLFYLLGHFSAMIAVIVYARINKRIKSSSHAILLLTAVFVNISVWLMEQFVDLDFEFLSVSYIVSELFLLGISLLIQDITLQNAIVTGNHTNITTEQSDPDSATATKTSDESNDSPTQPIEKSIQEKAEYLESVLYTLTPTEGHIYRLYMDGKKTKDVMAELGITENTLKFHNRNLYSKLGVSTRKELIAVSRAMNTYKQ